MGIGGVTRYGLRMNSEAELHAALVSASAGRPRAYAAIAEDNSLWYDEARVRIPYAEAVPGDADPVTGERPSILTGAWLSEVALVGETDDALAGIAVSIVTEA